MRGFEAYASKTAALALLAAFGLFVWIGLIQPLTSSVEAVWTSLDSERSNLGRYTTALDALKSARSKDGGSSEAKSNLFLKFASPAIMTAGVQSELLRLARHSGVRLERVRTLPRRESEHLALLGVEASLTGKLVEIETLLVALERAQPVLLVNALHIAHSLETEPGAQERLRVRLEVLGATLNGSPDAQGEAANAGAN